MPRVLPNPGNELGKIIKKYIEERDRKSYGAKGFARDVSTTDKTVRGWIAAQPGKKTLRPKSRRNLSMLLKIAESEIVMLFGQAVLPNIQHSTIADSLRSVVKQDSFFESAGLRGRAAAIIDDIISFAPALGGKLGLPASSIETSVIQDTLELPKYVWDFYHKTTADANTNKLKMFLTGWESPIFDTGDVLRLKLVPHYWHLKKSMERCGNELREEIIDSKLDFESMPGALATAITIETTDNDEGDKLLLCQRGKTDDKPFHWMVGIGELMEPADGNASMYSVGAGTHPVNAVLRGVGEELGLKEKQELLRKAEVSFLALARSSETFNYNMLCHVRLPASSDAIIQSWRSWGEGEIQDAFAIDFELDTCIDVIVSGLYSAKGARKPIPIVSWSRASLLAACVRKFGTESVQSKLAVLVEEAKRNSE
jgi:hypothetical protein